MKLGWLVVAALPILPAPAYGWGAEGHQIVAAIARSYLSPAALAKADAILASDPDALTAPDMISRSTWADAWRNTHRETASWHFVNIELDHPDVKAACFDFPHANSPASAGPAQDCLIDKITEFADELADPAASPVEQVLALKYLLHFVGDLHQPLHVSDNQDRGGNCVQISLGGVRTTNLHAYWDKLVVGELGSDPAVIAKALRAKISPADKAAWEKGDPKSWALEGYALAKSQVYTLNSKPGCDTGQGPLALPAGYDASAQATAAQQLEKAGVRLALVLNRALDR